MIATSDLPTLYKTKKVCLWVEDEETRTYLTEVWQDPEIGLLVADGHTNLQAVVASSRQEGFAHVFGFRDRDPGQCKSAAQVEVDLVGLATELPW